MAIRPPPLPPSARPPTTNVRGAPTSSSSPLGATLPHAETELSDTENTVKWARGARGGLIGKVLGGKYDLMQPLGAGGMGEVYRARHLSLGIDVAVKVMHAALVASPDYARRFRREALAVSLIQHRNVVKVIDYGEEEEGGLFFLVMEHLAGRTMAAWLAASPLPPPLADVADVLGQVLEALGAAHAAGIVHRDLKPDNVFLTIESDGRRIVKVVDFGLAHVHDARDTGPTLTQKDMVSGTPAYMSPEQSRSLAVGPSTDIYAVGCILTDMLQLAHLFEGNALEVLTKQMYVAPGPLRRSAAAPAVPPLLERLRLDLLAKDPLQRPHTARDARARLLEALSPERNVATFAERSTPTDAGDRSSRHVTQLSADGSAPRAFPSSDGAAVAIVRLTERADGAGATCALGLSAQTFAVREAPEHDPQLAANDVLVLDAGDDLPRALAWLARWKPAAVVVCLADATAARMTPFIAAGISEIIAYPITSDVLARKVRRAVRRSR